MPTPTPTPTTTTTNATTTTGKGFYLVKCRLSSCTSISLDLQSLSSFRMVALSFGVNLVHGLSARRSYSEQGVTSMQSLNLMILKIIFFLLAQRSLDLVYLSNSFERDDDDDTVLQYMKKYGNFYTESQAVEARTHN